jgi:hypothetical protein
VAGLPVRIEVDRDLLAELTALVEHTDWEVLAE